MIISIVNRSAHISDEELLNVIRAINRQIKEDFEPYWSMGATLRLEGAINKAADRVNQSEMRGDAILYVSDEADVADALGYHEANYRGIPYGFVFTKLCKELGEEWTVTLSHEALELVGDAQGNLLVQGPHPEHPRKQVFHWFEMCDAVQSQKYKIDGVEVSNFVLPLYFTPGEQDGGRNDFLGVLDKKGRALSSFGVAEGGYIGFYDPETQTHDTYFAATDAKARRRSEIKNANKSGRGYLRKRGDATLAREEEHAQVLGSRPADPIRHVVVLMLENRSFDHMLGDANRLYSELDGIPQDADKKYSNTSRKTGKIYRQQPNAAESVPIDPPHELADALRQIGDAGGTEMAGFVDAYENVRGVDANDTSQVEQVMAYFPMGDRAADDSLPALHALARNFLICDHWFSSLPGPTWPNRLFAHSGTCLGHVLMPSRADPGHLYNYDQLTIYDRLQRAGKKWRIYHRGIPQSVILTRLWSKYGTSFITDAFATMGEFFADAKGNEADFPAYTFIEPDYFGDDENDQHPPADVSPGDRLIAKVYNALRANKELWNSTLLIITYDEHGGFYDHVPPPPTIAPDKHTHEYSFTRLGVRVPAILVSPWVRRGVCSTTFDHTSILRYLCDKWGMGPLGERTSTRAGQYQANSFHDELTRYTAPRPDDDTPPTIAGRGQAPRGKRAAAPVEGAREALMCFMASMTAAAPATGRRAAAVKPVNKLSDEALQALAQKRFAEIASLRDIARLAATSGKRPAKKKARAGAARAAKKSARGNGGRRR